eukprot:Rhum_TRINITY_DN6431_c0_g1::Rhum_TRINITY_DN6431_c0_g1_i1::g.20132::m.20132
MNKDEILREIHGTVRAFKAPHALKHGETEAEAERRQLAQLTSLFSMLRVGSLALLQLAASVASSLLARRRFRAVQHVADNVIRPHLAALGGGGGGGGGSGSVECLGVRASCTLLEEMARLHLRVQGDPLFQGKATAAACLGHMAAMARAVESVFPHDEPLYHVVHNGTVLLFEGCVVLAKFGLLREAVAYLAFAAQCLESPVLAQTRYLPWRVRVLGAAALCYEALRDASAAARVAAHAARCVRAQHALEASDAVPPPPALAATLDVCLRRATTLQFRLNILAADSSQESRDALVQEMAAASAAAAAASGGGGGGGKGKDA